MAQVSFLNKKIIIYMIRTVYTHFDIGAERSSSSGEQNTRNGLVPCTVKEGCIEEWVGF